MVDNNKQYTNQIETIITAETKNARCSLRISIRAWPINSSYRNTFRTIR